jgi:hypothetical protein
MNVNMWKIEGFRDSGIGGLKDNINKLNKDRIP